MSPSLLETKIEVAVNEIVAVAQSLLTREAIELWMSNNAQLWQQVKDDIAPFPAPFEDIHGRVMTEFYEICTHFTVLLSYFETETICANALDEYQSILNANARKHDNLRLQQWVRNYELIGTQNLCPTPIEEGDANNVKTVYDTAYVVPRKCFEKSMEFFDIFNHLFWEEQILPDRIAEIRKERREELNKLNGAS